MAHKDTQKITDLEQQIKDLESQILKIKAPPLVEKYLRTYSGSHLGYSLDEVGLWQAFGEDPNCDFGGHHHEPDLGFFSGKLKDVIAAAVLLPKFWTWGGGGRIRKVSGVTHV